MAQPEPSAQHRQRAQDDQSRASLTRRRLLEVSALLGLGGGVFAPRAAASAVSPATTTASAALPTPSQVLAGIQTMVDFGPRLTGGDAHNAYLSWLERQFTAAGLRLLAPDDYTTERWLAQDVGLLVHSGPCAGEVPVAAYYPRSQETAPGGVTGPLVYCGAVPALALDLVGAELPDILAAANSNAAQLQQWVSTLEAGTIAGSILAIDLPMPLTLTTALLVALSDYLNWPGHGPLDWLLGDYTRTWLLPGLTGLPTAAFKELGVAGVVGILDCSYAALQEAYIPFENAFEVLPVLWLDRQAGATLRSAAATRPSCTLTLTASRERVPTRSVTAVLPGASSEVIILNTHSDGTGFVEENGGVALVQLASYYAALPAAARPQRTLVFAAWPGHMACDLPQLQGWINAHPDLIARAAAAITVEHLGCTEWVDGSLLGYHATGLPETLAVWSTLGETFTIAKNAVVAQQLPRTAIERPGIQFGVGGAFQTTGVPQVACIAGPTYMLSTKPDGDIDKLDPALAARQIAWLADLVFGLDPVPAATLRQGDPTLGKPSPL